MRYDRLQHHSRIMIDLNITVVIPTYNRAALIGRAIESVLAQTCPPAQVLVVDDGSTDDTLAVCQAYANKVDIVRQNNAGASVARNTGVRMAKHPWIAFLDSDDYWDHSHLENMRRAIQDTSGVAQFYFSDMALPFEEGGGTLWGVIGFRPEGDYQLTADATPWVLLRRQPTMLQSSVFSKQVLEACGGLLPQFRLMHDSDLYIRLGIGGSACAVTGVGCIQTAEDQANNRLTGIVTDRTEEHYVEQLLLWRNAMGMASRMQPDQSRLVRYNLAVSHWRLTRRYWRSRKNLRATLHFIQFAWTDFALLLWIIRHQTVNGFEAQVRPACPEIRSNPDVSP